MISSWSQTSSIQFSLKYVKKGPNDNYAVNGQLETPDCLLYIQCTLQTVVNSNSLLAWNCPAITFFLPKYIYFTVGLVWVYHASNICIWKWCDLNYQWEETESCQYVWYGS